MGLQLGCHQKYYISRCEEKQSIQLTITVVGDDKRERRELIDDVTQLLDDIMKVFMPEIKKPTLMVPCPLCPILHITLSEVSTGNTIFCPRSGDASLPSGYYGDLSYSDPTSVTDHYTPETVGPVPAVASASGDPTPTTGEGSKDNTLVIVQCNCYSIS